MTVSTLESEVIYNGDGSTTVFPVPFLFQKNEDLTVSVLQTDGTSVPWEEPTNYTLTGAGNPNGGTLTATTAPAVGEQLVIARNTPLTQETNWEDGDDFLAETQERSVDKLTLQNQDQERKIGDAVRRPEDDAPANMILPRVADRANKTCSFDGAGNVTATDPKDPGSVAFSPYGEGLVSQANAPNARTYLGAASQAELQTVTAALISTVVVGSLRPRLDTADLTPTWIPCDARTIGKAGTTGSAGHVANDGLRELFDIAKALPPNTGAEDFDAGNVVILPDLRGRGAIGQGQGPSLTLRAMGATGGVETHALTEAEMPAHTHDVGSGGNNLPQGTGASNAADITTSTSSSTGGDQPHENMPPFYAANWEVFSGVLPTGEQLNAGQIGIQWNEGGWVTATAYQRNDALRHPQPQGQGAAYIATADHTSAADTEPGVGANWQTVWAVMVYDGLPGTNGGTGDMTKAVYDANDDGVVNAADVLSPQMRAGETLAIGEVVAIDSVTGGIANVKKANATAFEEAYGVMLAGAANGALCNPARTALVTGINTTGTAVRDPVFLKDGGGYQFTRPDGAATPEMVQVIGWVAHVGAGDGAVYFEPQPRELGVVRVTVTAQQMAPHNTLFSPTWDKVIMDTMGATTGAGWSGTALTVPRAGRYTAQFQALLSDTTGGTQRYAEVTFPSPIEGYGRDLRYPPAAATFNYFNAISAAVHLAASGSAVASVFHDQGGSLGVGGTGNINDRLCWFQLSEV